MYYLAVTFINGYSLANFSCFKVITDFFYQLITIIYIIAIDIIIKIAKRSTLKNVREMKLAKFVPFNKHYLLRYSNLQGALFAYLGTTLRSRISLDNFFTVEQHYDKAIKCNQFSRIFWEYFWLPIFQCSFYFVNLEKGSV